MARKKKTYSVNLDIGKKMPPLYHTLPDQDFRYSDSEVLKWIANQPTLLNFVKDQLRSAGYITYDATTGKWTGIDYRNEDGR